MPVRLLPVILLLFITCCRQKPSFKQKAVFEKLILHVDGSDCLGFCSVYHLQVDSNGHVLLYKERVFSEMKMGGWQRDSTQIGYYKGIMSDTLFNRINAELSKLNLDSLGFDGSDCCDGVMKTLVVYYQGKHKVFRAMFPPQETELLFLNLSIVDKMSNCNGQTVLLLYPTTRNRAQFSRHPQSLNRRPLYQSSYDYSTNTKARSPPYSSAEALA